MSGIFGTVFGTVVWILLCILVGKCADRWNRSFIKYLILSILFSPLIMGKNEFFNSANISNKSSSMNDITNSISGSTWTCRKCGDKNSLNNSYCKGCGEYKPASVGSNEYTNPTPVVKNEGNEWTCKECNEKNPLTASNCKSCGAYK